MKENLAISDHLFKESGDHGTTVYCCAAAQALRAGAKTSFPRTPAARLASRTLQTLRYTQLSMPSRPGARSKILSHRESSGSAAAKGLRPRSLSRASQRVPGQLPAGKGNPQGDLPHQRPTASPPRATLGRQRVRQRIATWNWPYRYALGRYAGGQHDRSVPSGRCLPFFTPGGVR
jgi:hypothetical protein